MFQIGAFCRLAGVSAKVLRDYDEAGLFRPAWVDRASGYRLYSPAQLPQLRRIVALRDLGVGLAEISRLVDGGANLHDVLERRRQALEDQRREAERRLSSLGITLAAGTDGDTPDVVVRDVPAELVATLDVATVDGDVGRAFYELELRIRDAGVRAARPPGGLVRSAVGRSGEPPIEVFVPVRRGAADLDVCRLPQQRMATVLHRGPYETVGATRRTLDAWIDAAGLRQGEPVRTLYLQFGAEEDLRLPSAFLVSRSADLLTEIQVPLE